MSPWAVVSVMPWEGMLVGWRNGVNRRFPLRTDHRSQSIVLDIAPAQGYTTAAIIYEDTLFPTSTANGAAAHCETAGIEVVLNEVYPAKATDVSSVLTRVRDANPDMLIGGSYLDPALQRRHGPGKCAAGQLPRAS